ncbi:hypothetical protein [Sphingomonas sp.]|uniref:hypothetical protein n=1 Tax=Sphingomonas sp. TaxID=28214 RepID=UPI0025DB0EA7|nr:hypothetical protein [Sphingomonas sp.]
MTNLVGTGQGESSGGGAYAFEPLPFIASERRLHVRAYNYWRGRADDRAMPTLADCDDVSESGFADQMILVDLPAGNQPARIRTIGPALSAEMSTADTAGTSLVGQLLARLPTVALQRTPIGFEAETPEGGDAGRCFRGILLPIADAKGAIAHVMGVMSWRKIAAELPGRDVAAALASIGATPPSDATLSPWSLPPVTRDLPTPPSTLERIASAHTWAALAKTDRPRARAHLHAAIGAAHDGVAGLPAEEARAQLRSIFDDDAELPAIERTLEQARLLAIGGHDLARRLDAAPGGVAEFAARWEAMPDAGQAPPRARFRLTSIAPELMARSSHRSDDEDDAGREPAGRAAG